PRPTPSPLPFTTLFRSLLLRRVVPTHGTVPTEVDQLQTGREHPQITPDHHRVEEDLELGLVLEPGVRGLSGLVVHHPDPSPGRHVETVDVTAKTQTGGQGHLQAHLPVARLQVAGALQLEVAPYQGSGRLQPFLTFTFVGEEFLDLRTLGP